MDKARIRTVALKAIQPVKAADDSTEAPKNFLFGATRTAAGRQLPEYYLVYFLLVELLGFRNLGQFEKIAWSVPIDFKGRAYLIEHRKFGIGVFGRGQEQDEKDAADIVRCIRKGIKVAAPYFEWLASEAVRTSKINVNNHARELFNRYSYLRDESRKKFDEAERRKDERIEEKFDIPGGTGRSITFPAYQISREAQWLAHGAIEAFFSWTEHVFVLLAIIQGRCADGLGVSQLARAEWADKYKAAIGISTSQEKRFHDELSEIRRQLRNFVAHGAFGKQGEAFAFHSGAGAVPVLLPKTKNGKTFRFGNGVDFVDREALTLLEEFIDFLWSDTRGYAKSYIQEHGHPLIMTMVSDGTYAKEMASADSMEEFSVALSELMDRHANMDF